LISWIVVRGGGDLATGTVHRLWSAGFRVLVLDTEKPAAIRRQVSVCEAIYQEQTEIEGMVAVHVLSLEEAENAVKQGYVPVLVDPKGEIIDILQPEIVIDAILAKRNLGTHRGMAPLTVALGPGFVAGEDVDVVVETQRGHNLGRVIHQGCAAPNTGVPGMIGGYASERVIHAPCSGILKEIQSIGDTVAVGETIAFIVDNEGQEVPVLASIPGIIRGLIRDGYKVTKGLKIADIDPRLEELKNCFTISDKARCIAGSVLEVVVKHINSAWRS